MNETFTFAGKVLYQIKPTRAGERNFSMEVLLRSSSLLYKIDPMNSGELWYDFINQNKYFSLLDWYYSSKQINEQKEKTTPLKQRNQSSRG